MRDAAPAALAPSSKLQRTVGAPGPGMQEPAEEKPTAWPTLGAALAAAIALTLVP